MRQINDNIIPIQTAATVTTANPINFDTKEYDSHNATTTGSAWKYVAPVSGLYSLQGVIASTTGTGTTYTIYKNSAAYKGLQTTLSSYNTLSIAASLRLNAGDFIDIRPSGTVIVSGGALSSNPISILEITRTGN